MFEPLSDDFSYPAQEEQILEFWRAHNVFQRSLELQAGRPIFSFFEGPPTVNGRPGIHHVLSRTIKDTICRYKSMAGYSVRRQAGWDTHGLPVELAVEKKLGIVNKSEVELMGVEGFNHACREFVYSNIEMSEGWRTLTDRMGYWVDLDSAYITCTNDYIESVWWALKQFFDKGLIYQGFKVVPQSPTIETPLSSHELSLGYRDVRDPNVYLKLRITSSNVADAVGAEILVWTTTPWTLFANVALAVGEDIDYCLVRPATQDGEASGLLILAESRLSVLGEGSEIVSRLKGRELVGSSYEQIFPYCAIDRVKYPHALTILPGTFVSTDDGTGVVHLAPAFGVDDYEMSKKFNLPVLQPVSPNGHFTEDVPPFAGRAVKTLKYADHVEEGADKDIVKALKQASKILKASFDYLHPYPHCWRTDNPVIYYARHSWFIKSPSYKDEMIRLNKTIRWQPPEIGSGRFGNWLEEVKDWSLSRDRFWGTPLPIWVSEDGSDMFAVGSIAELMEGQYELREGHRVPVRESGVPVDLHRPFVDRVVFELNGKTYRRTHEVVDVWFDSGCVPFAQMHYPFENKELFEASFPADFIAEGIDQTRGWFYTLHNIASAIFGKPAFRGIIVNELILDKNGQKMSKSKGNTVDPFDVMNRFGADAVRWYFFANNPPWRSTLFNEEDIAKTVVADFFRSLTNIYSFFSLYANIDGFNGSEPTIGREERPEIDRWIVSKAHAVLRDYRSFMDEFEVTRACRLVQEFVRDHVSNWYVRRNRRRFWKGENDRDKTSAYQTLSEVMKLVVTMIAPVAPFLAENLYRRLKSAGEPDSVHFTLLPAVDDSAIDADLNRRMELAQRAVFLGRQLRENARIKTRQPLRKILIPILSPQNRRDFQSVEAIILEELNVKVIEYVSDDTGIVKRSLKPNFKVLGKRFGKRTQHVADCIKVAGDPQIRALMMHGAMTVETADGNEQINLEEVDITSQDIEGWLVASEGVLTVALDTEIDDALRSEGMAREVVSKLQNLRKTKGFEVTDRIRLVLSGNTIWLNALKTMSDYVRGEVLAEEVQYNDHPDAVEIIESGEGESVFAHIELV